MLPNRTPYTLRYHRSAGWTTSNANNVAFGFDAQDWDPLTAYNSGTGVFTAPTAGAWRFSIAGFVSSSASGQTFQTALSSVNGTTIYASSGAQFLTSILVQTVNLAAGGQVTTQYSCNAAGLTGGTGTGGMYFTAELVGLVI